MDNSSALPRPPEPFNATAVMTLHRQMKAEER